MEKITNSQRDTQKLGEEIGNSLKQGSHKGRVLALYGELGSGKTTFVQGLAKALGLPDRVVSPTFIISKKYGLQNLPWSNLYHIDCYRLDETQDLVNLGFSEIFSDPKSVAVVEWAEKVEQLLPEDTLKIYFETLENDKRKITFR